MAIEIERVETLDVHDFIEVLVRSGLSERRPFQDPGRIGRMIQNSNLIVVARDTDAAVIVGVARSVTDFSYCCYLSDLAVDKRYQRRGIGKQLIDETRKAAGAESMCLLISAPGAVAFYQSIGMSQPEDVFVYKRER